jgi:hypothetical protein
MWQQQSAQHLVDARPASKTPTGGKEMLQKPKPTLSDGYPYQNRFKKNTLKTQLMSQKAAALDQKKLDHSPSHPQDDIDKVGGWSCDPHSTTRAIQ